MSSLPGARPPGGGRGTSTERDHTKARETHWRALATAAALEEKIERLNQSITQGWPDAMPTLGVVTAKGEDPKDEAGDATGFGWRRALPTSLSIALPSGVQNLGRMERLNCLFWISTWNHCWS